MLQVSLMLKRETEVFTDQKIFSPLNNAKLSCSFPASYYVLKVYIVQITKMIWNRLTFIIFLEMYNGFNYNELFLTQSYHSS